MGLASGHSHASDALGKRPVDFMKINHKKTLTFGDLIESVYNACNPRRAKAIVRFAVNTHVVVFRGQLRLSFP
jgi:hypothetical protein